MVGADDRPISLFYSYSHKDEALRIQLQDHLAILRHNKWIAEWHDRDIEAGEDWAKAIDRNLETANIILLLVSASFIASDYCWGKEMTKALDRHDQGEATVVPVILKPCRWQSTPFAKLQALPKDGKPVIKWSDPDTALENVAAGIERLVEELRDRRAASMSEVTPQKKVGGLQRLAEEGARARALAEAERLVDEWRSRRATSPQVTGAPSTETAWAAIKPLPMPTTAKGGDESIPDFAVFRDIDAEWCPEMVALPAGEFLMGSPENERERQEREGPQHRVTIGYRLAIGRYPVTVEEYEHFCDATGGQKPDDEGWGRGRRPVINVSWDDAQAYCAWLAKETGRGYRLPSEAEWEYVCRAGTTTRYAFGDNITTKDANFGFNLGKTTEVGAYPPNAWGLHDMHGNVWEWAADVWHEDYQGAPVDGSAWMTGGDQTRRVLRGGSWYNSRYFVRSVFRGRYLTGNRYNFVGFRVARTLTP